MLNRTTKASSSSSSSSSTAFPSQDFTPCHLLPPLWLGGLHYFCVPLATVKPDDSQGVQNATLCILTILVPNCAYQSEGMLKSLVYTLEVQLGKLGILQKIKRSREHVLWVHLVATADFCHPSFAAKTKQNVGPAASATSALLSISLGDANPPGALESRKSFEMSSYIT